MLYNSVTLRVFIKGEENLILHLCGWGGALW
jgi:hypothetical protein